MENRHEHQKSDRTVESEPLVPADLGALVGYRRCAVVWASGEREKVESTLAERAKVVNQLDGFHRGNLRSRLPEPTSFPALVCPLPS